METYQVNRKPYIKISHIVPGTGVLKQDIALEVRQVISPCWLKKKRVQIQYNNKSFVRTFCVPHLEMWLWMLAVFLSASSICQVKLINHSHTNKPVLQPINCNSSMEALWYLKFMLKILSLMTLWPKIQKFLLSSLLMFQN